ncbi:S41 family peptidase [Sphingobacterium hungaricum]|nr:S41 family peptidase [Sphingobacterium hungaricum]
MKISTQASYAAITAMIFCLFLSCKKNESPAPDNSIRNENQLVKDSVFYYFNLYSLWSDGMVPDNESMYAFTDQFDSPSNTLLALKSTTPYKDSYAGSIDRFSYIENITNASPNRSFGIYAAIGAVSENLAYPIVYFVDGNSPAKIAGIKRSDKILTVNNQDLKISISCDANGCRPLNDTQYESVIKTLFTAMHQQSMQLKIKNAESAETSVKLDAKLYTPNSIIENQIFEYPNKNIGYLALSSFQDLDTNNERKIELNQIFSGFEDGQINDLVFDLRYNSGGSVSTAEYLANKLINEASASALMYSYELNPYLTKNPNHANYSFEPIYFKKNSTLNLNTVYFLVTDATASASELLIHVLKPYMNVVVVAENSSTYGKPVGFFKQEIMNKIALWVASFKFINAQGETDYWNGFAATIGNVPDNLFYDFGDKDEPMLARAISHSVGNNKISKNTKAITEINSIRNTKLGFVNLISDKYMLDRKEFRH